MVISIKMTVLSRLMLQCPQLFMQLIDAMANDCGLAVSSLVTIPFL